MWTAAEQPIVAVLDQFVGMLETENWGSLRLMAMQALLAKTRQVWYLLLRKIADWCTLKSSGALTGCSAPDGWFAIIRKLSYNLTG
jgi:hypothetical protein